MIKDDWAGWLAMVLWVAVVMFLLTGCANKEELPPIADYRVQYGFNP